MIAISTFALATLQWLHVLFAAVWCTTRTLPTGPTPRAWDPLIGLALVVAAAGFGVALWGLPASRTGSMPEDDDRRPLDAACDIFLVAQSHGSRDLSERVDRERLADAVDRVAEALRPEPVAPA